MPRTVGHIKNRLYTTIDRVPFSGEVTARDEDVLESPSRTVADTFVYDQIHAAQRDLIETCKALYLMGSITTFEGAWSTFKSGHASQMMRPLIGRIYRKEDGDFIPCRHREKGLHRFLESTGRSATPHHPAFVWDEHALEIYPEPTGDVRVPYLTAPTRPTSDYDELVVEDVLETAVLAYVTSRAQRELGRYGLHKLWKQLYERFTRPYLRTFRVGRPSEYGLGDSEAVKRVDEPEVNSS